MGILDKIKKKNDAEPKAKAAKTPAKKADTVAATKKAEAAPKSTTKKRKNTGNAYKILLRPILTEKALKAETKGVYTFEIGRDINKVEVKNAVKAVYGVLPAKVRIMNMDGKNVRFGRRFGRRKDWKKAMVTLPKGKTINIHEGV